jgi:hypothetical protein
MSKPLKKGATYADLFVVADDFVAEILAGELYASPRPTFSRMRVASTLGVLLGGPFQFGINGPGGWLIVDESELHLGADVLVPDLAGWRSERATAASAKDYPTVADPSSQTLEIMQRTGRRWSLLAKHQGSQRVRAAPFEAVELELGAVWVADP